jgi:uncharacterized membrane protein
LADKVYKRTKIAPPSGSEKRFVIFPWIGIGITALIIRLSKLNAASLWYDELFSVFVALRETWVEVIQEISFSVHPPAYFLLLNLFTNFGTNEETVRLLSVLSGTISVLLLFAIGKQWIGLRPGFLAALLLCLSVFHVFYSQETRMYTLFSTLSLISFYRLLRLIEQPSPKNTIYLTVANVLMLYTHYFAFLVILCELFSLVWVQVTRSPKAIQINKEARDSQIELPPEIYHTNEPPSAENGPRTGLNRLFIVSGIATLLLFSPWLIVLNRQLSLRGGQGISHARQVDFSFFSDLFVAFSGNKYLAIVFVLLIAIGSILVRDFHYRNISWGWLIFPLVCVFAIGQIYSIVTYRNLIFILPFFYLSIAMTIDRCLLLIERKFRDSKIKFATRIALIIGILAFSLPLRIYFFDPENIPLIPTLHSKPNWRELTATLNEAIHPNDLIIFPDFSRNRLPIRYYLGEILATQTQSFDPSFPVRTIWQIGESHTFQDLPVFLSQPVSLQQAVIENNGLDQFRYEGEVFLRDSLDTVPLDQWRRYTDEGLENVQVVTLENKDTIMIRGEDLSDGFIIRSTPFLVFSNTPYLLSAEVKGVHNSTFSQFPRVEVVFLDDNNGVIEQTDSQNFSRRSQPDSWQTVALAGYIPAKVTQAIMVYRIYGVGDQELVSLRNPHFWSIAPEQPNQINIPNSSFEIDSGIDFGTGDHIAGNSIPDGWSIWDSYGPYYDRVDLNILGANPYDGFQSIHLETKTENLDVVLGSPIYSVEGENTIYTTVYARKSISDLRSRIEFQFFNESLESFSFLLGDELGVVNEWTALQIEGIVPLEAKWVKVRLRVFKTSKQNGYAQFDSLAPLNVNSTKQ